MLCARVGLQHCASVQRRNAADPALTRRALRKVARRAGTSVAAESPNGTRGSHQRGFEASAWLDAWLHTRAALAQREAAVAEARARGLDDAAWDAHVHVPRPRVAGSGCFALGPHSARRQPQRTAPLGGGGRPESMGLAAVGACESCQALALSATAAEERRLARRAVEQRCGRASPSSPSASGDGFAGALCSTRVRLPGVPRTCPDSARG